MKLRWLALPWLAALALVLLVAGQGLRPKLQPAQPQRQSESPISRKPTVPLQIELIPSPAGQEDRWTVRVQSLGQDRDVVLRMGSAAEEDQRVVWQGRLTAGREQSLDVQFAPVASTASVWAALEVSGLGDAAMRAVAQASRPGVTPAELSAEPGQVLQNPDTGEEVIQHTGQVEEER